MQFLSGTLLSHLEFIVKLNYMVFLHKPYGNNFAFAAKDDEDAKAIILQFLKDSKAFKAEIHPWDPVEKDWNFDKEAAIKVYIEEEPSPQETEIKYEVRYVKYVKYTGNMVDDEFNATVRAKRKTRDMLPDISGWVKYEESHETSCSDDERYHAEEVDEVKLG